MDRDARWSAGVKAGKMPIFERNGIIVSDELHQHRRDQYYKVSRIAEVVLLGYNAHGRRIGARFLCR